MTPRKRQRCKPTVPGVSPGRPAGAADRRNRSNSMVSSGRMAEPPELARTPVLARGAERGTCDRRRPAARSAARARAERPAMPFESRGRRGRRMMGAVRSLGHPERDGLHLDSRSPCRAAERAVPLLLLAALCVPALGCAQGRGSADAHGPDSRLDAFDPGAPDARLDALGLDAPAVDAPGLDAPGLDAPMPDAYVAADGGGGTLEAACCAGATPCTGILVCRDGRCRACGRSGDPCCAGDGCNVGLTCTAGMCTGCGARGEACCPGTAPCATGSRCVSGMCDACECTPGERRETPCALCGVRVQTCLDSCSWGPIGDCTGMGECEAGMVESVPCERCGTRSRTCSSTCRWGLATGCLGMGECEAGTTAPFVDGVSCGACQAFECDSRCRWSDTCSECTCSGGGPSCTACAPGYHSESFSCSAACGSCAGGVNQVNCQPNCGSGFSTCDVCPVGYHTTAFTCSAACGSCGGGTNQDRCEANSAAFSSCRQCPAGYHAVAFTCSAACGSCGGGTNQDRCEIDTDTFMSCRPCPSGYRSAAFSCSSACGSCGGGNNQVRCERM